MFKQSLLQLRDHQLALARTNQELKSEIGVRTEAEHHLRIYAEVIRSTSEAVTVIDLTGKIIKVNPAYEDSIGRSREELIGTSLYGAGPDHDFEECHQELWRSLETEGHWSGEILRRRSDLRANVLALGVEELLVGAVHSSEPFIRVRELLRR